MMAWPRRRPKVGEEVVRGREMEMPGSMGNGGVLGILIPHDLICLFLLWPSSFLLSSQVDPLFYSWPPGYFVSSRTSPFFLLFIVLLAT